MPLTQPNDDKWLYKIAYYLVKTNENFDEDFFKQELRKNSHAGLDTLNDTQFEEFSENRIAEIQNGRYVLSCISDLIFL